MRFLRSLGTRIQDFGAVEISSGARFEASSNQLDDTNLQTGNGRLACSTSSGKKSRRAGYVHTRQQLCRKYELVHRASPALPGDFVEIDECLTSNRATACAEASRCTASIVESPSTSLAFMTFAAFILPSRIATTFAQENVFPFSNAQLREEAFREHDFRLLVGSSNTHCIQPCITTAMCRKPSV